MEGAIDAEYAAGGSEMAAFGTVVQHILGAPTSHEMNVSGVAGAGSLDVKGTDHKLWLEAHGWQTTGRTVIDSNVASFAPA